MDAPHRRGLRHGPEFAAVAAGALRVGHVDGQIRQRAPEVHERDTVGVVGAKALVVYVDRPVDDDIVRGEAQARHGGVETDLKVEGGVTGTIGARLEEQRIALSSELIGDLLACHRVDRRLDLTQRHAGIEDVDIRTEVGLAGRR